MLAGVCRTPAENTKDGEKVEEHNSCWEFDGWGRTDASDSRNLLLEPTEGTRKGIRYTLQTLRASRSGLQVHLDVGMKVGLKDKDWLKACGGCNSTLCPSSDSPGWVPGPHPPTTHSGGSGGVSSADGKCLSQFKTGRVLNEKRGVKWKLLYWLY